MPLDFYSEISTRPIFSLDHNRLDLIGELLLHYYYRTGVQIDPYGSGKLEIEHLGVLLQVIEEYKVSADLNRNREKAAAILGMSGLLQYCVDNGIDLRYEGD